MGRNDEYLFKNRSCDVSIFCHGDNPCPTMKEGLIILADDLFGIGLILNDNITEVILG